MKINMCMKMMLPWADEIVKGKFPILIRKMNTKERGKVGIQCSQGYDGYAIFDDQNPNIYEKHFGNLIGSIEIYDVKKIPRDSVMKTLKKDGGKKFAEWYPKHFIPNNKNVYFWYLKKPKKFKEPFIIDRRGGIAWTKLSKEESTKLQKWK